MDAEPALTTGSPAAAPIDLAVLERVEAELEAVERALERIDDGIYDGFEGLGAPDPSAGPGEAASPD